MQEAFDFHVTLSNSSHRDFLSLPCADTLIAWTGRVALRDAATLADMHVDIPRRQRHNGVYKYFMFSGPSEVEVVTFGIWPKILGKKINS